MPRILPRLIDKLAHQPKVPWSPFTPTRLKPKSLHRPIPPRPSFNPAHHSQSILLSPEDTNPITSSRVYTRHKSLPPRIRVPKRVKAKPDEYDRPRDMSDEERSYWSSPYLRMLASPIRKCIVTSRYLPADFLIRLGPMRVPHSLIIPSKSASNKHAAGITLIPDGLQHPKFRPRRTGHGSYILCNKESVALLVERQLYKRIAPNAFVHALLSEQIAHLLRVRVLQELELLADQLESPHHRPALRPASDTKILRRLTREEWQSIRSTGIIPYPNALAVLVVPPLNKDPVTKKKPEASMSTSPLSEDDYKPQTRPPLPLSTLHPTAIPLGSDCFANDILPEAQIPLYNGITLFPARPQRKALHMLLSRLLNIERRTRYRDGHFISSPRLSETATTIEPANEAPQDRKASHAFLLCSNAESSRRGDIAAVAIALWRVRMFEGSSLEDSGVR